MTTPTDNICPWSGATPDDCGPDNSTHVDAADFEAHVRWHIAQLVAEGIIHQSANGEMLYLPYKLN